MPDRIIPAAWKNSKPLSKAGNNALFSNSFLIFITRFFPSLANLLVMIWYSKHLLPAVYGAYQNFWIQLYVISSLVCLGIHVLVITYSPAYLTKLLQGIKPGQYILYALWSVALAGVFAALQYHAVGTSFIIPFLFLLCFALAVLLEAFLIVFRNYKPLIIINVLYAASFLAIHWYALGNGFSLRTLFTGLLAIVALRLCVYAGMAGYNAKQYNGDRPIEDHSPEKIRTLWLHLGLYDVLQVLFSYIDKFVISVLLAASVSAVYFNGSQNIPFLPLLIGAAGSAVLIQLSGSDKQREHIDTMLLMNQVGRMLSCIVFPVFLFLFLFRVPFMIAVFSDKYIPAIPIFAVSILVLPVRAYHFTTVLQRMHMGAIINIGAIGDLVVACLLMYPLYRWLGLPGVALSFVISTYLQASFYLLYTAKAMQVSPLKLIPYTNWLIKMIFFAAILIGIRYTSNLYFVGSIPLILGGAVTVVLVAVSLLFEFRQYRQHGIS